MRGPGPGYAAFDRDLGAAAAPPDGIARDGSTGSRSTTSGSASSGRIPAASRASRPTAGRGINDVSIVLLGEVAGRRFLLTGDVEDDVDPLLAQRGLPPIDILKVAHHGSATASTPAFLDAVRPRVAIVSAGAGNPYGHPARSTIDRLAADRRPRASDRHGRLGRGHDRPPTEPSRWPRAAPAASPPRRSARRWRRPPAAASLGLPASSAAFSCGIPSGG